MDDEKKKRKLLKWHDMPRYLQFNPYILTGYRPVQSVWDCVHSLFYFHNETINILTHGVPIVYILATVPGLLPWKNHPEYDLIGHVLPWCHLVGSVAPWVGSFFYHLFMNCELGGERLYHRLLQMDMLGIWMSQSIGAMPMVIATVHCMPLLLKYPLFAFYVVLSIWGLYKALTAWSPWERRLCFALPFLMRVFFCGLRSLGLAGGNPDALLHVILQDAVSAVGGAIGAMHVPEKWFPGRLDAWFNSHNIMHVLVVTAVYSMHQATVKDLQWMADEGVCSARSAPEPEMAEL
ncbi:progestin and adipoQ receptor family member 4 [Cloeon dipterum]|uniref:progestin and adipoQ receptor family member 4 n=1 Tax=Cloeon dipterum TaxID=197152 RepID=UPI0032209040